MAVLRPAPSIAIASNLYEVDALLGQPLQLEFAGVALDVPLATPLTITYGDLGKIEVTLIPVG